MYAWLPVTAKGSMALQFPTIWPWHTYSLTLSICFPFFAFHPTSMLWLGQWATPAELLPTFWEVLSTLSWAFISTFRILRICNVCNSAKNEVIEEKHSTQKGSLVRCWCDFVSYCFQFLHTCMCVCLILSLFCDTPTPLSDHVEMDGYGRAWQTAWCIFPPPFHGHTHTHTYAGLYAHPMKRMHSAAATVFSSLSPNAQQSQHLVHSISTHLAGTTTTPQGSTQHRQTLFRSMQTYAN